MKRNRFERSEGCEWCCVVAGFTTRLSVLLERWRDGGGTSTVLDRVACCCCCWLWQRISLQFRTKHLGLFVTTTSPYEAEARTTKNNTRRQWSTFWIECKSVNDQETPIEGMIKTHQSKLDQRKHGGSRRHRRCRGIRRRRIRRRRRGWRRRFDSFRIRHVQTTDQDVQPEPEPMAV